MKKSKTAAPAAVKRPRGRPSSKEKLTQFMVRTTATSNQSIYDAVNRPAHYTDGGIEAIDFIEAKRLGYHLGNVIKYICRAGKKGTNMGLQDLQKARWYLDRAIEKNEVTPPTR